MEVALARLQDADRDVRRSAAEAITEGLGPGLRTRSFVFNAILLDKSIDDRLRGYPRGSRRATCQRGYRRGGAGARRRRRLALRRAAALLPAEGAAARPRPAPALRPRGADRRRDAASARGTRPRSSCVDAYGGFSREAGEIVDGFFARAGSTRPSGRTSRTAPSARRPSRACTRTCYELHRRPPPILTLAHELGHGLHGVLAQPLGLFNASTPLTLAETASVFGESLTFRR